MGESGLLFVFFGIIPYYSWMIMGILGAFLFAPNARMIALWSALSIVGNYFWCVGFNKATLAKYGHVTNPWVIPQNLLLLGLGILIACVIIGYCVRRFTGGYLSFDMDRTPPFR
jgi:hypothetical protein